MISKISITMLGLILGIGATTGLLTTLSMGEIALASTPGFEHSEGEGGGCGVGGCGGNESPQGEIIAGGRGGGGSLGGPLGDTGGTGGGFGSGEFRCGGSLGAEGRGVGGGSGDRGGGSC